MLVDRNWSLLEAFENLNAMYSPGGIGSGPQRNRQIETWGQLVGRTRALAEFDLLIDECGSVNKMSKLVQMSSRCIKQLKSFYENLPNDKSNEKIYQGMKIKDYFLLRKIGSGGNADVWQVRNSARENFAMKILKRAKGKPLQRFINEINIIKKLNDFDGVLPIIDSFSASHEVDIAWYTMPIATPLTKKLLIDSSPNTIFDCLIQISDAITELHARGIYHRDIKPDNLFFYKNKWVIGDFGIASYPEKQALTSSHKKLGPLHFIAPEMLQNPDKSSGEKADVYSFAKTIWVLIAGQQFPPPGEQRCDVIQMSLTSWSDIDFIEEIDQLIEQCTKHEPELRPSMYDVTKNLIQFNKPSRTTV